MPPHRSKADWARDLAAAINAEASDAAAQGKEAPTVRVLGKADRNDAIDQVLVPAFVEPPDPLFWWVVKEDGVEEAELKARLRSMAAYMLAWVNRPLFDRGIAIGIHNNGGGGSEGEESGRMVAVATVRPPGVKHFTLGTLVSNVWALGEPPCHKHKKLWGEGTNKRFSITSRLKEMEKDLMAEFKGRYLYVMSVGVLRECRGRGRGGALMRVLNRLADMHQLPLYLETESEENEAFYKRHGYHTLKIYRLHLHPDTAAADPGNDMASRPQSGQPMWLMKRMPAPVVAAAADEVAAAPAAAGGAVAAEAEVEAEAKEEKDAAADSAAATAAPS